MKMIYKFDVSSISQIEHLKEQATKEGLLFPKSNMLVTSVKANEDIIGFGCIALKKTKAILKCVYVSKEHRGNGLASTLLQIRLGAIKNLGIKYAEANCTKLSLNVHLRKGAAIIKQYKNGITKVAYENI